jgi:hypothetical protein
MKMVFWLTMALAIVGCGASAGEESETDVGALGAEPADPGLVYAQLTTIQNNVCVPQTGRLDSATREAIRQAKMAARESAQASATMPFDNIDGEIKSHVEAQIFVDARSCSTDSTGVERGYRSAFEKFRFSGPVAINGLRRLLSACGQRLENADTFDAPIRAAIAAVVAKAPTTNVADADPSVLNDKSYAFIRRECIF